MDKKINKLEKILKDIYYNDIDNIDTGIKIKIRNLINHYYKRIDVEIQKDIYIQKIKDKENLTIDEVKELDKSYTLYLDKVYSK